MPTEPETVDPMEELAEEDNQVIKEKPDGEQPPAEPAVEPEKLEVETPPAEPEKKETETPEGPEELLPDEDLKAIFNTFDEDAVEEKPAYQPPAPAPQPTSEPSPRREAPAIPQEVLNITPQQFMPEGQDFDPTDAYTPNSASNQAALRVQAEQNRHFHAIERERVNQEQIARQGAEAIDVLNARMEKEKWPKAMRQKFWNKMTNTAIDLDMLADSFVLGESRALRKARKAQPSGGSGESPAPVNKASRVSPPPHSRDQIKKRVADDFGDH